MSDHLDALRAYFERDQFAATSGVRLLELAPGYAKAALTIEPRHLNSVGIVQGGAVFTLADFAFAVACNAAGRVAVAVSTNLTFFLPTQAGTLTADAREVSRSRRLSVCTVEVRNELDDRVALFQGTAYIKNQPMPPAQR